MNLKPEEQDLLKDNAMETLKKLHEEITKRIGKGELSSKSVTIQSLLDQFQKIYTLLKSSQSKINLMLPIEFEERKMRRVENLVNSKPQLPEK